MPSYMQPLLICMLYRHLHHQYIPYCLSIFTFNTQRSDRRCVLGAERTFERRDSSICCYIDPAFQRAISNVSCICSREDYDW